jgi:hypothetical protein
VQQPRRTGDGQRKNNDSRNEQPPLPERERVQVHSRSVACKPSRLCAV